jgi:hypothetical protein
MATITRVYLFTDQLYAPGGMVWRHVGNVTRHFAENARDVAPVRSGELRRRIRAGTPRKYAKHVRGSINSNAPHTSFVIHGTHGPIMTRDAWDAGGPQFRIVRGRIVFKPGHALAIGRNPWPPEGQIGTVAGQRANNFFYQAWVKTSVRHSSIRGVPFPAHLF